MKIFKIGKYTVSLCILFIIASCASTDMKPVEVDFEQSQTSENNISRNNISTLNIAVATMISPKETFKYYTDLFKYLSDSLNIKVSFKQRNSYKEVNDLILANEVDIAFVCTGAYLEIMNDVEILVVPICNGHPYYQAYVITQSDSEIANFKDFEGKKFAFTDPMSNTGKLYIKSKLEKMGNTPEDYFKSYIYTSSHDVSIQMVAKNMVDGASIDGLVFDYMAKRNPKMVENIKIIEKSPNFGIPPIVASSGLNIPTRQRIIKILESMHLNAQGKKILDKLMIESFVQAGDTLYLSLLKK